MAVGRCASAEQNGRPARTVLRRDGAAPRRDRPEAIPLRPQSLVLHLFPALASRPGPCGRDDFGALRARSYPPGLAPPPLAGRSRPRRIAVGRRLLPDDLERPAPGGPVHDDGRRQVLTLGRVLEARLGALEGTRRARVCPRSIATHP